MWLRTDPTRRYSISSDLTQAGRIDVPVFSTERRVIAPYHIAYIQVNTPTFLSYDTWDASITGHRPHIATANSLIRFKDQKSFVQIINCTARQQKFHIGQHIAVADLYIDDADYDMQHVSNSSSSIIRESPMPNNKEGLSFTFPSSSTTSINQSMFDSQYALQNNSGSLIVSLPSVNVTCSDLSCRSFSFSSSSPSSCTDQQNVPPSSHSSTLISSSTSSSISLHSPPLISSCLSSSTSCRTSLTQHHIDTGDSKPIKLRPYRVSPARQSIIYNQIQQMLQDGIIEPANGPYAASVTLQPKKDGSLRFCVDFRQLNSATARDVYRIPHLKSGFWQIELDEESRPKTAFVTHAGLYHFTVMPFGLTNAPATFQRLMDLVLGGLKWTCALVYLDDIIVYSSTFSSHLQHLESVLQRIQASGLTLHLSKCQFCKTKLRYLGHVVSQIGIEPDPEKIRAVRDYSIPNRLKDKHQSLRILNSTKPFILQLDASDVGLSAILAQKLVDDDGVHREHVIGYANRTLSASERKFSPTERECLAIVYGCSHFRPYLEGLHNTKDLNSRLARWAMQIAVYDVDIQHRPGVENTNCDALSRAPVDDLSNSNQVIATQESYDSSPIVDHGYSLVLDYLRHSSLPPPQLVIPISLSNITTTFSPISSYSISLACLAQ
ncbi:unnamed protein product [Rotaria magnacalcarata]|uniref:Reverse transcriptase domain-containing protein n=2 Tax=Rotaria magnacalcarata TaxID=392030 RepID=A0A8S2XTG7_9BILA|nr:unnamed protein product [Rotaria magnacalcarata]